MLAKDACNIMGLIGLVPCIFYANEVLCFIANKKNRFCISNFFNKLYLREQAALVLGYALFVLAVMLLTICCTKFIYFYNDGYKDHKYDPSFYEMAFKICPEIGRLLIAVLIILVFFTISVIARHVKRIHNT